MDRGFLSSTRGTKASAAAYRAGPCWEQVISMTMQGTRKPPLAARLLLTNAALGRTVVGGFFLSMGGVHLGIVAADAQFYRPFADQALFGFVRDGWADIFMAHPQAWGLAMVAGETMLGVLLLAGRRYAKLGWTGVIVFHLLLMLFGFAYGVWSIPALMLLVPLARADWPRSSTSTNVRPRSTGAQKHSLASTEPPRFTAQ
jgi:hypothetical protein